MAGSMLAPVGASIRLKVSPLAGRSASAAPAVKASRLPSPTVRSPMELSVGQNVKSQLEADLKLETNAVAMYNKAVQIAREHGDDQSREIFSILLKDEEMHVDWLEAQLHQIQEMGYERYLSNQTEGPKG